MLKVAAATAAVAAATLGPQAAAPSRRIAHTDLPTPIREQLAARGIGEHGFADYISNIDADTERRIAEGEREHLIYYALQSTRFTNRPRIEPAVSAKRFVEGLPESQRSRLLEDGTYLPTGGWPAAERARVADLVHAFDRRTDEARVDYFRQVFTREGRTPSLDDLYRDYVRVARFLYMKEFVAPTSSSDVARIARLYQTRPHSSDTQTESGFGVYLGLGALQSLSAGHSVRINRVLIVGPGLDLASRTDLFDRVPPQSYQPFAVADALLALSLASEQELHVRSIDANRRVVSFLESVTDRPLTLHLFSGIAQTPDRPFSDDYRAYARQLGLAIGAAVEAPRTIASDPRYLRSIAVRVAVSHAITAERLNVITERLTDPTPFDLVVATNVLTYFEDDQLALALCNIGAMLRPGGYFIHNESRRGLAEIAATVAMPVVHMRTAVIAGPAARPLYDAVWLHRKES